MSKFAKFCLFFTSLFLFSLNLYAQDAGAISSPPQDIPKSISEMLAQASESGGMTTAVPPQASPVPPAMASAGASRYFYNTLRVTNDGNPRGCGVSDWNCMANLCKADLNDQNAWRGWAGCWREGNKFICYFECSQYRTAF